MNAGSILGTACLHVFLCLGQCGVCSAVFATVFAKLRVCGVAVWRCCCARFSRTFPGIRASHTFEGVFEQIGTVFGCVCDCVCERAAFITVILNIQVSKGTLSLKIYVEVLMNNSDFVHLCLLNACSADCVCKCVQVFSIREHRFSSVFGCVWVTVFRLCLR